MAASHKSIFQNESDVQELFSVIRGTDLFRAVLAYREKHGFREATSGELRVMNSEMLSDYSITDLKPIGLHIDHYAGRYRPLYVDYGGNIHRHGSSKGNAALLVKMPKYATKSFLKQNARELYDKLLEKNKGGPTPTYNDVRVVPGLRAESKSPRRRYRYLKISSLR